MFKHLSTFPHILVTGPQRSGTTICAAMIAHDTGLEFLTEEKVPGLDNLRGLLTTEKRFVLQCPQFCRYIHEFSAPDTLIVMMRRECKDIIASEIRIGWQGYRKMELARYGVEDGVISDVKYAYWDAHQKHMIQEQLEVEFESLKEHPLWIPKSRRLHFGPRQISISDHSVSDPA